MGLSLRSKEEKLSLLTLLPSAVNKTLLIKPGSSDAREMTVASGRQWLKLYPYSDKLGMLVKKMLKLPVWESNTSLFKWKPKDIGSNRSLFQLVPLKLKKGKGSLTDSELLQTPTSTMTDGSGAKKNGEAWGLQRQIAILPTPRAHEPGATTKGYGKSLSEAVEGRKQLLPTPKAQNANSPGVHGQGRMDLQTKLAMLPTPQTSDHITKKTSKSWKEKGAVNFCLSNPEILNQMLPTPDANMGSRGEMKEWKPTRPSGHHACLTLNDAVKMFPMSDANQSTADGCLAYQTLNEEKPVLKLQPAFVEWMMGFPEGWTDIEQDK